MSDVSRGLGWWLASDQKWYPPEAHPSYQPSQFLGQWAPPFYPPSAAQYPYPAAPGYGAPMFANYGQRLGGWLLDWVILLIPSLLVSALTHSIHTHHSSTGAGFNLGMPGAFLSPIIVVVYGTIMCGSRGGQTLGMMVAGTRAVKASTGEPIGYPAALWRAVFEWLLVSCVVLPPLGY
jgi:uncharacterized RDD family membrane protein YckC